MTKPPTREQRTADSGQNVPGLVLTREELAAVLRVSVRTVDRMVTAEDIPVMDLGEDLVRFYLPDVLEALRSGKRKFGRSAVAGEEMGDPHGPNTNPTKEITETSTTGEQDQ